jgi:nitroreductase
MLGSSATSRRENSMLRRFRIDPREAGGAFPANGTVREKMMHLLRLAVLAPSIHNTQPWKFSVDRGRIGIFADRTRWLAAADPDQRDLHMSLGCLLENLLVAARHYGYQPEVTYAPRATTPDFVALVDLTRQGALPARRNGALDAIKRRRTMYHASRSGAVTPALLETLSAACEEAGFSLCVIADPEAKGVVAGLFREANARQLSDPRYRAEAAGWLRKGEYGLPRVMRSLGRAGLPQLERAVAREADAIAAAPYFAVLLAPTNDPVEHLRAGQAFERLWLAATARKVGLRPASALCEVPAMKAKLAKLVHAGERKVVQAFRLGFGEAGGRRAPRRRADESIVAISLH